MLKAERRMKKNAKRNPREFADEMSARMDEMTTRMKEQLEKF